MAREQLCAYRNCEVRFEGGARGVGHVTTVAYKDHRKRFCSPLHGAAWLLQQELLSRTLSQRNDTRYTPDDLLTDIARMAARMGADL